MYDYLKTYKIILTGLSPVFVGNGRSILKKEYIFMRNEGKVYVPDIPKMFEFLVSEKLNKKYEQYMLSDNRDLVRWLADNGIYKDEFLPWISYTVDSGDAVFENRTKKEILTFIKDAYGFPYIPGSGLKGTLRTALLAEDIIQNRDKYSSDYKYVMTTEMKKRNYVLKNELRNTETKAFNTLNRKPNNKRDAVNDAMAGLRISDSRPLSKDCLVLCQKIDEKPDGTESQLNILRECLKPGTEIEFDLTIDTSLTKLTPDDIMRAINDFSESYDYEFARGFAYPSELKNDIVYIGGGTGYATKTVTYQLIGYENTKRISQIIDATLGGKAKKEHAHYKDGQLGVSPHTLKRTYYNEQKQDMGICRLKIV